MGITLSKQELENLSNYKYVTDDWTPLDKIFDYWWEFVVRLVPLVSNLSLTLKSVAPNLITLAGLIVPIFAFTKMCELDLSLSAQLPSYVLILNAAALFWF